jgi:hypothetical protein
MEKPLVILVILLLFSLSAQAQQYRITREKLTGWGIVAVAGAADGLVEGYEFDRRLSFERKYQSNPYGFFGSKSWQSVYNDGRPEHGFKHPILKYTGAFDFYHTMDDIRKFGYISSGVVIGIGGNKINEKKWYYIIDFAAAFAISATTKSLSMRWIRS